jgi:hypothetical protein
MLRFRADYRPMTTDHGFLWREGRCLRLGNKRSDGRRRRSEDAADTAAATAPLASVVGKHESGGGTRIIAKPHLYARLRQCRRDAAFGDLLFFRQQLRRMASEQTPASAVFDESVRKLKLEIEQFPAGDSFCVRLPRYNCGVAMDAHEPLNSTA